YVASRKGLKYLAIISPPGNASGCRASFARKRGSPRSSPPPAGAAPAVVRSGARALPASRRPGAHAAGPAGAWKWPAGFAESRPPARSPASVPPAAGRGWPGGSDPRWRERRQRELEHGACSVTDRSPLAEECPPTALRKQAHLWLHR